jgi:hypothetical protein
MAAGFKCIGTVIVMLAVGAPAWGQESPAASEQPAATTAEPATGTVGPPATTDESPVSLGDAAPAAGDESPDSVDEVVERVDRSREAQQVSAGILKPIYLLAERFSFPAFHWVAFAVMAAGVVSFALQLVLGKLVVLMRMSVSLTEILSDGLGLAVSVIGLVLTTQAAAENSTFTSSAFSVLSATAAGVVAGFLFYLWGQRQELQAVAGRRVAARRDVPPTAAPRT